MCVTLFFMQLLKVMQRNATHRSLIVKKYTTQCCLDLPKSRGTFFFSSCPASSLRIPERVSQKWFHTLWPTQRRGDSKSCCRHFTWDVPYRGHTKKSGASLLHKQHISKRNPCGNALETFPLPNDPDRETITVDLQGANKLDFHLDLCHKAFGVAPML